MIGIDSDNGSQYIPLPDSQITDTQTGDFHTEQFAANVNWTVVVAAPLCIA